MAVLLAGEGETRAYESVFKDP